MEAIEEAIQLVEAIQETVSIPDVETTEIQASNVPDVREASEGMER